jgi:hypothetical protein
VTHVLRLIGDGLGFAAEMGALAALCYWGVRTGRSTVAKALLALGAMAALMIVWGVFFAAGGHSVNLPRPVEIAGKLAVFALAALALRATGRRSLTTWFAAVAVASVALEYTTS